MADYCSDIAVNSFIINFNQIVIRCMKTHSKNVKKFIINGKILF